MYLIFIYIADVYRPKQVYILRQKEKGYPGRKSLQDLIYHM